MSVEVNARGQPRFGVTLARYVRRATIGAMVVWVGAVGLAVFGPPTADRILAALVLGGAIALFPVLIALGCRGYRNVFKEDGLQEFQWHRQVIEKAALRTRGTDTAAMVAACKRSLEIMMRIRDRIRDIKSDHLVIALLALIAAQFSGSMTFLIPDEQVILRGALGAAGATWFLFSLVALVAYFRKSAHDTDVVTVLSDRLDRLHRCIEHLESVVENNPWGRLPPSPPANQGGYPGNGSQPANTP